MIYGYTAEQIRVAESPLLAEGVPLMQHAAFALAGAVAKELVVRRGRVRGARVVLLVGSGNNGGDTLHAGALLARRGVRVLAICTTDRPHATGMTAQTRAGGRAVQVVEEADPDEAWAAGADRAQVEAHSVTPTQPGPEWRSLVRSGPKAAGLGISVYDAAQEASTADVVLDGLLGIGGQGAPRGAAGLLIAALQDIRTRIPDSRRPLVVAVDVPSGIGVDDGSLPDEPVLAADLTVTFGAPKAGLLLPPATRVAGRIHAVDIGLELSADTAVVRRMADVDAAALWPVPNEADHKYSRGVLGVVAGTAVYPGAAVLTTSAAALAGVGMVRYLGPDPVVAAVLAARPEVVHGSGQVQAWVLGPGVEVADIEQVGRMRTALDDALTHRLPTVLDAGALSVAPPRLAPWIVLTPHAGELAGMLARYGEDVPRDQVEAEPLRWVRHLQELTGATVLLKGSTTVVAGSHNQCWAQSDAPAWLATAGAGDVLAGLLGALLAGSAQQVLADAGYAAALAATAALVHGRAAERAVQGGPVTALAVATALPCTVADLVHPAGPQ